MGDNVQSGHIRIVGAFAGLGSGMGNQTMQVSH